MNKQDNEYLSDIKSELSGSLSLAKRRELQGSLKKVYSDDVDKINSIPSDLVALAIATECDIDSYVDFHEKDKQENSEKKNIVLVKKMSNIF